jgi:microcystin-dependent protein
VSQPYVGEIRMFGGNFAPAGWMFCQGQLLPISENETLFNLIGTTYGGDGQSTFGLPDLQGRAPLHSGTLGGITYVLGEKDGVETVTVSTQQMPIHTHPLLGSGDGATTQDPTGGLFATSQPSVYFNTLDNPVTFAPQSIGGVGGNQPHDNMQPYLCVSYIISLFGIFPHQ